MDDFDCRLDSNVFEQGFAVKHIEKQTRSLSLS